jgi:ribonuclease BN (tRNA processing enzyme)
LDPNLLKAAEDVDVLIYDCMYTEDEYSGKVGMGRKGWGHSTWVRGIELLREAGAKRLVLWHHDPVHDDEFVRKLESAARKEYPDSLAAYEGLTITL